MNVHQLIRTHPAVTGSCSDLLVRCIEHCFACAQTCTVCADACLAEPTVSELRECVRLNLDCAQVCAAAGSIASRRTGSNEAVLLQLLDVCAVACQVCAQECERHSAQHEHCRICAHECRQCEESCRLAMQDIGGASGRIQTN